MAKTRRYRGWNSCSACGFQGVFVFTSWEDESYDDPDALGAMLDTVCPACEERESVLVAMDEFRRMTPVAGE